MHKLSRIYLALVLPLLAAALACNLSLDQSDADKIATVQAVQTEVAAVATDSAALSEATAILPEPSLTPTAPAQATQPLQELPVTVPPGALDPTQLAALDPTQLAVLQATQMAGADPTQAAALQATQAASMDPTQVAALQFTQAAAMGVDPTQVALVMQATQMAQGMQATQDAFAPQLAELSTFGVDPSGGQLGWVQPPLSLEINQYRGNKFDNAYPLVKAQDFVMATDYTWDTQYGAAGCALVFRSDGDQDDPNQYMVATTRLAGGYIYFAVMAEGEIVIGKEFYANGLDPSFNSANSATNRIAVVGRGPLFTIYSNGTRLGDADPNRPLPPLQLPPKPSRPANMNDPAAVAAYQAALAEYNQTVNRLKSEYNRRASLWASLDKNFESGYTALGVVADSGQTRCDFDNAYLWLIGGPPAQ